MNNLYLKSTLLHTPKVIISIIFLVITLIAISQDLLYSSLYNSSFYLSESLLFKAQWLLFILSTPLLFYMVKKQQARDLGMASLLLTLLVMSCIHIIISSFIISFVAQNFLQAPFSFTRILKDLAAKEFYLILIFYTALCFLLKYFLQQKPTAPPTASSSYPACLPIKQGQKTILLPLEQIDWIKADSPYVLIYANGAKYHHHSTLKHLCEVLSGNQFVRIHRSCIVNISKIKQLQSRLNGDYDLLMENGASLRLSRSYCKELKQSLALKSSTHDK